jgi:hypothetical protein
MAKNFRHYFFDVPVYRLPEEQYYQDRTKFIENFMSGDAGLRQFYETHRNEATRVNDHLATRFGGCWRFNEIVGHVRLHFLGSQIRGEYYGVRVRRFVRTRRKILEWQTHKLASEISVPPEATNAEIGALILKYVDECRSEMRGRYFDTETLAAIIPYMDWRRLIGWNQ